MADPTDKKDEAKGTLPEEAGPGVSSIHPTPAGTSQSAPRDLTFAALAKVIRSRAREEREGESADRLDRLKRALLARVAESPRSTGRRTMNRRYLAAAAAIGAVTVVMGQLVFPSLTSKPAADVVVFESGTIGTSRGTTAEQTLKSSRPEETVARLSRALDSAGIPYRVTYSPSTSSWSIEGEATSDAFEQASAALESIGSKLSADGAFLIRIEGQDHR